MMEKPNTEIQPFLCSKLRDKRGIAAVIFDWDDTILDSSNYYKELHRDVIHHMNEIGYPEQNPHAFDHVNRHDIPNFQDIYSDDNDITKAESLRTEMYLESRKNIPRLEGARSTLRYLKSHHIPFAIASNTQQEVVRMQFEHIFGDEFPNIIVVGSDGPNHHPKKPDPAMIKTALKQMGHPETSGKAVYFVGDTHNTDIDAAAKLKLSPVLFSNLDVTALIARCNHPSDAETLQDAHTVTPEEFYEFHAMRHEELIPHMVEHVENHMQLLALFEKKLRQHEQAQPEKSNVA